MLQNRKIRSKMAGKGDNMAFDFENYEHRLVKIKRCRTELSQSDLEGRYKKSFRTLLDSVYADTDKLVSSQLCSRFPDGEQHKNIVLNAMHRHEDEMHSIYRMVSAGKDMIEILCSIMDLTDVISEEAKKEVFLCR